MTPQISTPDLHRRPKPYVRGSRSRPAKPRDRLAPLEISTIYSPAASAPRLRQGQALAAYASGNQRSTAGDSCAHSRRRCWCRTKAMI
ncbi:MAG: hypothetical protein P8O84_05300 [Synechococcus sp. cluster3_bin.96]|nr:hypothetical protein [Synechococcus sp. cluster3_bin.96]